MFYYNVRAECYYRMQGGGWLSHQHLGHPVRPRTGYVRFTGMERYVKYTLVQLLPVGGDLLHTGFGVHAPQADGAVVACKVNIGVTLVNK